MYYPRVERQKSSQYEVILRSRAWQTQGQGITETFYVLKVKCLSEIREPILSSNLK